MYEIIFIDDYTLFDHIVIQIDSNKLLTVAVHNFNINIVNVRSRTDHGHIRWLLLEYLKPYRQMVNYLMEK